MWLQGHVGVNAGSGSALGVDVGPGAPAWARRRAGQSSGKPVSRISPAGQRSAPAAVPGRDKPARGEGWRVPRWFRPVIWRRPLPGSGGISLEPAGPVQGGVPGGRAAGLVLALAVTAVAAAQYATGRPFTTLAWLAIAPLLGSLVLPPRLTGLLAGWTVLLGLGLALSGAGPPGHLVSRLAVLVLLAAFAVANSVLRSAAQRRLGQARAVARVAQSALLREVPQTVAAARLASRYVSASAEARVGGDLLEVVAGSPPTVAGRRHQGQGAARGPAGQRRRHQLPGRLRPAGPVAAGGGAGS